MQPLARYLIRFYQLFISPLLGAGKCRYHPTCSVYAQQAIARDGLRGAGKAAKRILTCHPLCMGGIDPYDLPTNNHVKK